MKKKYWHTLYKRIMSVPQPSTSCYKASNNKYFNCPPLMADGRHFTDYRPQCQVMASLSKKTRFHCSLQQRLFLTTHGAKLIQENQKAACVKNSCAPCHKTGPGREDEPTPFSESDNASPHSASHSNCCADSSSLFNYYGHSTSKAQGELMVRVTLPSGGKAMSGGDPVAYNA